MRALILGARGQLGRDLELHCVEQRDTVLAYSRAELDITDAGAVTRAIVSTNPEVIYNCAAWTNVDACEADPERAHLVNGLAVGYVAAAADAVGAHLVQVSTDYVFDGDQTAPYSESDRPSPRSAYGRSKLVGEQAVGDKAAIVRTSWVYSKHGGNIVETLCRLMDSRETVEFVTDQVGRPTHTVDLARALRAIAADRASGIFHCANAGACSWFDFAQAVYVAAGEDADRVHPISTSELHPPRPARRPANSVLATPRFDAAYGALPDFRLALPQVAESYREQRDT